MKDSSIYRQQAIDSFNQREEFQRAIRIVTPKSWLYLIIFYLLFTVGILWLVFGTLTTRVQGQGMIIKNVATEQLDVTGFFNTDVGKKIKVGMPATVFPTHISTLEYGGMEGRVNYISEMPVSHNNQMLFEVNIELFNTPNTLTGYRWTTSTGPFEKITPGTFVQIGVMTKRERIIDIIFHIAQSTKSKNG